jgi:hypothetical protein
MDHPFLAAVYECRDAVGKSVLTNRQGLHSCRLVIKEVPTSAATKMAPEQPSATALPNQGVEFFDEALSGDSDNISLTVL